MLCVVVLNVVMMSVIILIVVKLSVVAPCLLPLTKIDLANVNI
jgi:hypothetical protein